MRTEGDGYGCRSTGRITVAGRIAVAVRIAVAGRGA